MKYYFTQLVVFSCGAAACQFYNDYVWSFPKHPSYLLAAGILTFAGFLYAVAGKGELK